MAFNGLINRTIQKGQKALERPSVRGAIWTVSGFGSSQVVRFIGNLVLTRLLVPEYFGIMTIVNSLHIGLIWLADVGVGKSIVRSKRWDDQVFLDTAWILQILNNFIVLIAMVLASVPMARFYDEPQLAMLLPVVGLGTFINGFNSTKIFTLNRQMQLGLVVSIQFVSRTIGLIAMIAIALVYPSVWSLVIGGLIYSVLWLLGSHFILPGPLNRFRWDQESFRDIFSFGRWVWLESTMMFLSEQSDRLILGALFTFELLGVYSIAFALADLPRQVVKKVSLQVIFPLVSSNAELPRAALKAKILTKRKLVLWGFSALIFFLSCTGDVLIQILYDDRYDAAAWMMPMLSLGCWFSVLFYTTSPCLLGIDKPVYPAQANLMRFIVLLVGIPTGYYALEPAGFGPVGAVLAVALSDFPSYLLLQYGSWKEHLMFWSQDLKATIGLMGAIGLVFAIRVGLGFGLSF